MIFSLTTLQVNHLIALLEMREEQLSFSGHLDPAVLDTIETERHIRYILLGATSAEKA